MLKALLFDLDGTLVSSLPELAGGVNAALVKLGRAPLPQETIGAMIGKGLPVLCDKVAAAVGLTDVAGRERLWQGMLEAMVTSGGRHIAILPGVQEMLLSLSARGFKTALVTNKRRDLTLAFIEARGLLECFDAVVCGDDCAASKPAPDMLLKALRELEVTPDEAVMIGDSRNDAVAARAAGVRPVLVEGGYNEGCEIAEWAREEGFDAPYESAVAYCRTLVHEPGERHG